MLKLLYNRLWYDHSILRYD